MVATFTLHWNSTGFESSDALNKVFMFFRNHFTLMLTSRLIPKYLSH